MSKGKHRSKAWGNRENGNLWDCKLLKWKWKVQASSSNPDSTWAQHPHGPTALSVILTATRRAVKEEVIDCSAWPLFALTRSCLGLWLPCVRTSHESRRDWWALWVDRAPLSSPHPSFRQGFLITVQPPETKAAMFVQMDWVGLIFLTSLLLQQWPTLAGCIHCWSDTCIR